MKANAEPGADCGDADSADAEFSFSQMESTRSVVSEPWMNDAVLLQVAWRTNGWLNGIAPIWDMSRSSPGLESGAG